MLREALHREGGDWATDRVGAARRLRGLGAAPSGSGCEANENSPKLRTHDRFGNRIDEVEFHPAWHELMDRRRRHGPARAAVDATPQPGAHAARAAMFMVSEPGGGRIRLPDLDDVLGGAGAARAARARGASGSRASRRTAVRPRACPAPDKPAALVRHGDDREAGRLRRAREHDDRDTADGGGPGAEYEITGHKWFCSAPMCDAFLVLAQTESRRLVLPAAAVPARRDAQPLPPPAPQGQARQPLQRLVARSSSTAPGRRWSARRAAACATIIEMVNHTRLDCVLGCAAGMRAGAQRRRSTTPSTARRSASCWSTSR